MAVAADVVVVGGGVIGTAIAWRAAAAGLGVVLVDPARDDGASLVAAGMLAPVSESMFGEEALLRLNLLAVRRFPTFAAELEERTGQQVGLRQEGTLAVAYDPGDHAALLRLTEFRRSVGLDAAELDSRAIPQAGAVPGPGGPRRRPVRGRLVGGQPALPGRAAPGGARTPGCAPCVTR